MAAMQSATKVKLSVSLDPDTVRALDAAVREGRFTSRSEALEQGLRSWVRAQLRRARNAEVDAYYDGLTIAEAAEDSEWAELAHRTLQRDCADRAPTRPIRASRTRAASRRRGG